MTDCSRALRLMYDKIDRVLDGQGEERLQAHLESCPRCVREYEDIVALHSLYSTQRLVEPTTDLASTVLSAIMANAPKTASKRFRGFYWQKATPFAQAALASVLIYFLTPYLLGFKPWWNGFRFSWQILAVDVSFLSSLSLPEITVLIPGLAARAAQPLLSFCQIVADNLRPNLLATIAGLFVLQVIGNKVLFSSVRT